MKKDIQRGIINGFLGIFAFIGAILSFRSGDWVHGIMWSILFILNYYS
jgi:hypothetical protein